MTQFAVGSTYRCTSAASGKVSYYFRVTSRTNDAVRLVDDSGKHCLLKIFVRKNVERCLPKKRLRLGLILTADSIVNS